MTSKETQINCSKISRRSLLALSSVLTLDLVACGGANGTANANSSAANGANTTANSYDAAPVVHVNTGTVTTLAGSTTPGSADNTWTLAAFLKPKNLAVDRAGNVYVADTYNHMIRKITVAGVVTTLAGSTSAGSSNGVGAAASFRYPSGLALDSNGNVYVADTANNMIRMITPSGVVSTFAGSSTNGSNNGPVSAATFYSPSGLAFDSNANLYVADTNNQLIRVISATGTVSTLAGGGFGSNNGTGNAASFRYPSDVTVDSSGNVYVADTNNHMIRMITPAGVVTTLAGSTTRGSTNDIGSAASFFAPFGVDVDANHNVYVADTGNNMIRMITPAGVVTTLAGSTTSGSANGNGTSASFNSPNGVAVDTNGVVYVADTNNNMIRLIA